MASQVAHIIYARKYLKKHPLPNGDADLFMLGCIFPDIRRIDESIKRKDTHLCFNNCDLDFSGLSPFKAGWKFHLYCDMRREEVLNHYKFYDINGTGDFWHQPAKLLEDEILYDEYQNWEKLVGYFNNVPMIDAGINVEPGSIHLWYAIIAKYLEKKPGNKEMRIFLSKQPSWVPKMDEIMKTVDKLRENEKVIEILKKVAEEII